MTDILPYSPGFHSYHYNFRVCNTRKDGYMASVEELLKSVSAWQSAKSLGSYFNANIKGRYDCWVNRVPTY